MQPVLTTAESGRLDREAGDRIDQLMERAGWALAGAAIELGAGYGSRISVLTGPGNNGGDGWVAARRLAERGCLVTAHPLTDPKTAVATRARDRALRSGVDIADLNDEARPDLIVDALFGSGIRDGLPPSVQRWIGRKVPYVAAHVPSGVDPDTGVASDPAFRADVTVAFHALSPGHLIGDGAGLCGRVCVADIGLEGGEPVWQVFDDGDVAMPVRRRTDHKWSAGSVLVVGGSTGMVGAAVMAAKSALRFGAGAVGLAVDPDVAQAAAILAPEILSYPQQDLPGRFDVILCGPGMGDGHGVLARVLEHGGPIVLDADALTSDLGTSLAGRSGATVLTPHAGELARLTGGDATWQAAAGFAQQTGAVVLLKGNPTFVFGDGPPIVVTSNGPELATIGTGDVLAGMVAALLARGVEPKAAAATAAHVHGRAGRALADERTVTADALTETIARYAQVTA